MKPCKNEVMPLTCWTCPTLEIMQFVLSWVVMDSFVYQTIGGKALTQFAGVEAGTQTRPAARG